MWSCFSRIAMDRAKNLFGRSSMGVVMCEVRGAQGRIQRKRGIVKTSASRSANFGSKKDLVKGREPVEPAEFQAVWI